MAQIIILGDWNDTTPAAPAGSDNVHFAVNRSGATPKFSASVKRATTANYGTILYDASGSATKYLGADGAWHDIPTGIPAGGLTGQVLTKHSNTDYDVDWEASGGTSLTWVKEEVVTGTADGVNATFTVAHAPAAGTLKLFTASGLRLIEGVGYTFAGTTVTMQAGYIPANSGEKPYADYGY